MIDLKKARLPQAIKVGGSLYRIHTDFKYFLRLRELIKTAAPINAFDFMYCADIPPNRIEGLNAICNFMTPPRELPRETGGGNGDIVLDYDIDADYIYAAFMEQYHIDLITTPLHWYRFTALLHGLHGTELNRIIEARLYTPSGQDSEYERQRKKQYEAWRLPQPEDNEPDEAYNDFMSYL